MKQLYLDNSHQIHTEGHSSKGDQPKWLIGDYWYKADYMGLETLSEVLVAKLLQKSNVSDFVKYDPVQLFYDEVNHTGCESKNFRDKNEQLIPFERLHRAYKGVGLASALGKMASTTERIAYTVNFVEETTGLAEVGKYVTMLLELDGFFLNEDRHTNNLAVIRNEVTLKFRMCPVFDNGLSLMSDIHDYPIDADMYECIKRVKAKPFSVSFDEQVEAAEMLYGSQLQMAYTHDYVSATLAEMSDIYNRDALSRVERVVFEQMRKYPIYF